MMIFYPRGALTDCLLDTLADTVPTGLLVGDGVAPKDGGWSGGQPGKGTFIPYLTLVAAVSTPGPAPRTIKDAGAWVAPYRVRGVGGNRQQADYWLDKARPAIVGLKDATDDALAPLGWGIYNVVFAALGGMTRVDTTTPPYWEAEDTVEFWLQARR